MLQHFPRPELARAMAEALTGHTLFSDAPNGLFLAAPRRTGKSTFLQQDLRPALEKRGVVVVYVDLWSERERSADVIIREALTQAMVPLLGRVARAAKASGLATVTLGAGAGKLEVDTRNIGKLEGKNLTEALRALIAAAKSPVALIIDEAQQALASEGGVSAMLALKSARDQINSPGHVNLMLVMSGSDRDKLLRLVNTNNAAFFGSQLTTMPYLGEDFIAFVSERIEMQRPYERRVDQAALLQAFACFNWRPQIFAETLGAVLSPLAAGDGPFEARLLAMAQAQKVIDETQMESDFLGLSALDQAVLWRVLEKGAQFRPYDRDALTFYAQQVGAAVTTAQVQKALDRLRDRSPSLVWRSATGEYAADEAAMHRWFERRVQEGTWPPG